MGTRKHTLYFNLTDSNEWFAVWTTDGFTATTRMGNTEGMTVMQYLFGNGARIEYKNSPNNPTAILMSADEGVDVHIEYIARWRGI